MPPRAPFHRFVRVPRTVESSVLLEERSLAPELVLVVPGGEQTLSVAELTELRDLLNLGIASVEQKLNSKKDTP